MATTTLNLPDELVKLIISNLDHKNLTNLALVSRYMYEIVKQHTKELINVYYECEDKCKEIERIHGGVYGLCYKKYGVFGYDSFCDYCKTRFMTKDLGNYIVKHHIKTKEELHITSNYYQRKFDNFINWCYIQSSIKTHIQRNLFPILYEEERVMPYKLFLFNLYGIPRWTDKFVGRYKNRYMVNLSIIISEQIADNVDYYGCVAGDDCSIYTLCRRNKIDIQCGRYYLGTSSIIIDKISLTVSHTEYESVDYTNNKGNETTKTDISLELDKFPESLDDLLKHESVGLDKLYIKDLVSKSNELDNINISSYDRNFFYGVDDNIDIHMSLYEYIMYHLNNST
ncbi:Uncharacterised protein [uncultured archaeon]|nr:Uncharacterised protein [uncultured archaeon]